jgi:hypothetical protein
MISRSGGYKGLSMHEVVDAHSELRVINVFSSQFIRVLRNFIISVGVKRVRLPMGIFRVVLMLGSFLFVFEISIISITSVLIRTRGTIFKRFNDLGDLIISGGVRICMRTCKRFLIKLTTAHVGLIPRELIIPVDHPCGLDWISFVQMSHRRNIFSSFVHGIVLRLIRLSSQRSCFIMMMMLMDIDLRSIDLDQISMVSQRVLMMRIVIRVNGVRS